jgi:hypothetical protein
LGPAQVLQLALPLAALLARVAPAPARSNLTSWRKLSMDLLLRSETASQNHSLSLPASSRPEARSQVEADASSRQGPGPEKNWRVRFDRGPRRLNAG